MCRVFHFSPRRERVLLVGSVGCREVTPWDIAESLEELCQLASSAGAQVVETCIQRLERPTAPFYIGKGKAKEIAQRCSRRQATSIIFDDELSPAQGRNLECITNCKVLDRTQLILDIFAQRARTREGCLQIELAQLQYLLPRLTRMWSHLSRQTGGIGTRGPGETQLEVDRRRVQERITKLGKGLAAVRKNRSVQRNGRLRTNWPVAALVGYTNAGKSSLFNRLTRSGVFTEDKPFATLDPTTRQVLLPSRQKVLLIDTVGFIRKLPHTLIDAFKATLEETQLADLLIHVVDLSHPRYHEQMIAVDSILEELEVGGKRVILAFNKVDCVHNPELVQTQLRRHPGSVAVSAYTGIGIDAFFQQLEVDLGAWRLKAEYQIPLTESALLAELHQSGISSAHYKDGFAWVTAYISPALRQRLVSFEVTSQLSTE
ncbi:MAG: GTPase HflX [Candidatus Xiphinematobacter sp.]|nr:MAG: GTPase HflX [Candidatus Xiphinematobacter sp.]